MKQATPPEERNSHRGSGRGRGRGGFAARGFAAAGLTRGTPRANGESPPATSSPAPAGEN